MHQGGKELQYYTERSAGGARPVIRRGTRGILCTVTYPGASDHSADTTAAAPVPVLPLEYAPPATAGGRVWRAILRVCLPLGLLTCVVGVALIYGYDVESVVGTGPLLFAVGLLTLVGGLLARNRVAVAVGAGHCGICLLFFGLVNLLNWSPNDAHFPFLVMGTVYTLVIAAPSVYAFPKAR